MLLAIGFDKITLIIVLLFTLILLISIILAIRFQNKQKRKYSECLKLIKEKENGISNVSNGINSDEMKKIDDDVDLDKLMMKLYDTYLNFIEKLNKNDKDFEGILDGFIKEFYENKIDIYQKKKHLEVTDDIELVNYSILEYNKQKLKFRINITCFNYKMSKQKVISGSNLERVDQIFLVTYNKIKQKWLINNIEKVFEKKLSV